MNTTADNIISDQNLSDVIQTLYNMHDYENRINNIRDVYNMYVPTRGVQI